MAAAYPLQAVLELRRRQRDTARQALAERIEDEHRANLEQTRLLRRGEKLAEEVLRASSRLYEPADDGTLEVAGALDRRADFEHWQQEVAEQQQRMERQRQAIAQAAAAIDAAREELLEATRTLEAIDKHFSRWLDKIARQARRREERLAEEINTSRFVSGQSG